MRIHKSMCFVGYSNKKHSHKASVPPLGIEPRAYRLQSGCATTAPRRLNTPCGNRTHNLPLRRRVRYPIAPKEHEILWKVFVPLT